MAKKQALGKGLDALMGDKSNQEAKKSATPAKTESNKRASAPQEAEQPKVFNEIDVDLVEVNPFQPRVDFEKEELEELAASIREMGIIQPLTVRRSGPRYEIISGERRLRAARIAGLKQVPAYIREVNDKEMRIMALVENVQRADLNAIEVAVSYQQIIEECELSHEELANRVGKSRTAITNHLRLLRLPEEIQEALKRRSISMGHARAILGLEQAEAQLVVLKKLLEKEHSVRETELLVRRIQENRAAPQDETPKKSPTPKETDPELLKSLQAKLGWGVSVSSTPKGSGKIVIAFRTEGEREELLKKLLSID